MKIKHAIKYFTLHDLKSNIEVNTYYVGNEDNDRIYYVIDRANNIQVYEGNCQNTAREQALDYFNKKRGV